MARARLNRPSTRSLNVGKNLVIGKATNPGASVKVVGGDVDAAMRELWLKGKGRKR